MLVGELDRLKLLKIAEKISRRIEGARFNIVHGVGHLINIENPEIFNIYVIGFLKGMLHYPGG